MTFARGCAEPPVCVGILLLGLLSGEFSPALQELWWRIEQGEFLLDLASDGVLSGGFANVGEFLRHSTLSNVDM